MVDQVTGLEVPEEIAVITQASDLALLAIADDGVILPDMPAVEIRRRISRALLCALRTGVADVDVLKVIGLAAVTARDDTFTGLGEER